MENHQELIAKLPLLFSKFTELSKLMDQDAIERCLKTVECGSAAGYMFILAIVFDNLLNDRKSYFHLALGISCMVSYGLGVGMIFGPKEDTSAFGYQLAFLLISLFPALFETGEQLYEGKQPKAELSRKTTELSILLFGSSFVFKYGFQAAGHGSGVLYNLHSAFFKRTRWNREFWIDLSKAGLDAICLGALLFGTINSHQSLFAIQLAILAITCISPTVETVYHCIA